MFTVNTVSYIVCRDAGKEALSLRQYILFVYVFITLKGKGSPYSITERRVPELIPVLGSQLLGEQRHNGCKQFA